MQLGGLAANLEDALGIPAEEILYNSYYGYKTGRPETTGLPVRQDVYSHQHPNFCRMRGDESSPLHCVVPFNPTGYIRDVPGTAHRPFPTVLPEGLRFLPPCSKNICFLFPWGSFNNIGYKNNCPLSTVNFPPVSCGFAGRFSASSEAPDKKEISSQPVL